MECLIIHEINEQSREMFHKTIFGRLVSFHELDDNWIPPQVLLDPAQLFRWEVSLRKRMPSYYERTENIERNNITLIIGTQWQITAKKQEANFKRPAHNHIDNEFHCSSISNITQEKFRLHRSKTNTWYEVWTNCLLCKKYQIFLMKYYITYIPFPWCPSEEQLFHKDFCLLKNHIHCLSFC